MIPVVYIHFGKIPSYFIKSVNSAAVYNKNIILLTDVDFKHDAITVLKADAYLKDVDLFTSVYEHMSTNSKEFEIICIKRWFILRNFMNQQNIDVCYYSDSDVMIYDDLNLVYNQYKEYDASYTYPKNQDNYRWVASACCSYWKKQALNKFCDFIIESYTTGKKAALTEKWQYHLTNNVAGGICDMTLLYLFTKEINFFSLSQVKGDISFDHNKCNAENYLENEYALEQKIGSPIQKKITWLNNQPYGYNEVLGKKVRFIALTEYAKLLEQQKTIPAVVINKAKSVLKEVKHKLFS